MTAMSIVASLPDHLLAIPAGTAKSQVITMDRRSFITRVGLGAAVLNLRSQAASLAPHNAPVMLTRAIAATGEHLPVIGMGTSGTFDVSTDAAARAPLIEVTRLLLETPHAVIDTAPIYGRAEAVSGDILHSQGWRKQTFLATKISAPAGPPARAQWQQSQQRLRSATVDVLQIHNLVDWRNNLAFLRELKEAGQVRYTGVTHYLDHAHDALAAIVAAEPIDFVQINLSVTSRAAERRLLPLCQTRGVAVIINRAFEDGRLFGLVKGRALPTWASEIDCSSWAQLFLKFVIAHPAVTVVIPATSKPGNMRDNLAAGVGALPDAKQRERIAALFG